MWKRDKGLAISALSALLALGCGGDAVNLGHSSRWTDGATSTGAAAELQTIYESGGAEPIIGFALDGPTLYALVDGVQAMELIKCPLTRCRSDRTTLFSRPKASNEGTQPTSLLVAAGLLYWVDPFSSERPVLTCPTTGCSDPQVVATRANGGVAADDEGVYWLDFDRQLMRRAHDAEAASLIQDLLGVSLDSGLMAHDDHVYFITTGYDDSSSIRRVRKDGTGAPEPVAIDQNISGFSFASDSLYYLTQVLTGRVAKCALEGCATESSTLTADQRWPGAIQVAGNEVFWLTNAQWSVRTGKATLMSCLLPDCATLKTRLVDFPFAYRKREDQIFAVNEQSIVWLENPGSSTRLSMVAR